MTKKLELDEERINRIITLIELDEENLTKLMKISYQRVIEKNGDFEKRILNYIQNPDLFNYSKQFNRSILIPLEVKLPQYKVDLEENAFNRSVFLGEGDILSKINLIKNLLPFLNEFPEGVEKKEMLKTFSNKDKANLAIKNKYGFFHFSGLSSVFLFKNNEKEYNDHINKCIDNVKRELKIEEIKLPENENETLDLIEKIINKTKTPYEKIIPEIRIRIEAKNLKENLEQSINIDNTKNGKSKKRRL